MFSITNKDFWIEFIDKYRSFPCLWNVHIQEYSNKQLREEALQELAEKCKEINPQANKAYVRKRIANIRTAFGREYKKIEKSKRTGSAANSVHVSTLWYYNELLFLKDSETSREGNSSLTNSADEDSDDEHNAQISDDCFTPPQTSGDSSSTIFHPPAVKRRNLSMDQQKKKFFEKASEFMSQKDEKKDDEFDILGKSIAGHFRNMELRQRLIAEKIVSDVLIRGRMSQLTMNSIFVLNPDSQERSQPQSTFLIDANSFAPSVQESSASSSNADLTEYLYFNQSGN